MMSFSDYEQGSKTKGYEMDVNEVYDLADEVAKKNPDQAGKAYELAERYSRKMADFINRDCAIGARCPSVMISGAGNFPVKNHQKQMAAWEKNNEKLEEIQKIRSRIQRLTHESGVIRSDDDDAIGKLERKLDKLKHDQDLMREANKAIRMKDTEAGDKKLKELGFSDERIKDLRAPDFCGRIGFPPFYLQNNNANIHRVEGRIAELKRTAEKGSSEIQTDLFRVVENVEAMRLQLFFDDKPEPEVRTVLKEHGFRWAPSQGAWQRQLTDNAKFALKQITEKLKGVGA